MITIISGTNKKNSLTLAVAENYFIKLKELYPDTRILKLDDINYDFITGDMYEHKSDHIKQLQQTYFNPASKFVFIIPEYNGSIPGVLKLLIDALEVRPAFEGKKAALIGVATGRAGNLRGLDHLSSILQHMRVTVMPFMIPISKVKEELDVEGKFINEATNATIERHVKNIAAF